MIEPAFIYLFIAALAVVIIVVVVLIRFRLHLCKGGRNVVVQAPRTEGTYSSPTAAYPVNSPDFSSAGNSLPRQGPQQQQSEYPAAGEVTDAAEDGPLSRRNRTVSATYTQRSHRFSGLEYLISPSSVAGENVSYLAETKAQPSDVLPGYAELDAKSTKSDNSNSVEPNQAIEGEEKAGKCANSAHPPPGPSKPAAPSSSTPHSFLFGIFGGNRPQTSSSHTPSNRSGHTALPPPPTPPNPLNATPPEAMRISSDANTTAIMVKDGEEDSPRRRRGSDAESPKKKLSPSAHAAPPTAHVHRADDDVEAMTTQVSIGAPAPPLPPALDTTVSPAPPPGTPAPLPEGEKPFPRATAAKAVKGRDDNVSDTAAAAAGDAEVAGTGLPSQPPLPPSLCESKEGQQRTLCTAPLRRAESEQVEERSEKEKDEVVFRETE